MWVLSALKMRISINKKTKGRDENNREEAA